MKIHPPNDDTALFYVEFNQFEGLPERWRLFKRQFVEEFKSELSPRGEVHPWQLANGEVVKHEGAVALGTEAFLCFLVDALNAHTRMLGALEGLKEAEAWVSRWADTFSMCGPYADPTAVAANNAANSLKETLTIYGRIPTTET